MSWSPEWIERLAAAVPAVAACLITASLHFGLARPLRVDSPLFFKAPLCSVHCMESAGSAAPADLSCMLAACYLSLLRGSPFGMHVWRHFVQQL